MASESDFGYRYYDIAVDPTRSLEDVAATWLNHLVVFAVRREMAALATQSRAVADLLTVTPGHLRKKMAGSVGMTIEDLVRLAMAFGPDVLPAVAGRDEIFPPSYRGRVRWDRHSGMARPSLA